MPVSPFISVIVVCKNPGPPLRTALQSIWAQREISLELIVIDGASSDGSREWLEAESARIAVLRSEPDGGVYEAMNKGMAAARGAWVLFLGADDRLASDATLFDAALHLGKSAAGVAVGESVYDDGRVYRLEPKPNPVVRNFVHHQAAFSVVCIAQ